MRPDVVLLDVMLPRISGIDVCRQLRKRSQVPIIMVTAKGAEIDTVVGLEVGADDYVTKPYRIRELVARMRAVLRRTPPDAAPRRRRRRSARSSSARSRSTPRSTWSRVDGATLALPLKEFELLHLLLANAGRVLPRETLIDRVWGSDYVGDTKTLDVHIKRLRSKVEPDPAAPTRIVTIRGLGYKYERPSLKRLLSQRHESGPTCRCPTGGSGRARSLAYDAAVSRAAPPSPRAAAVRRRRRRR